jgi:ABC-type lipoprotein export system ATPase subunit/bifunctional DNA-binding transcriptional regulator/antitoxin component of YhaV-PrlF toxin-antitoxin module
MEEAGNMIVCENLVKIYKIADLEVVALQGLDLIVNRGEMLGIVGTSGSGKTTLLNILGGLDRPSAGRVKVDGIDLLSLSDSALNTYKRCKVGFVWQQTGRNLIPYLSAQENVELPMTMAGMSQHKDRRRRSDFLLDAVGLYHRRNHHLTQLSGGEQQRVAISVALANNPVLLLGDEPTGEVDSSTAQSIMDTLHELNQEMGLTTIIVTHDTKIARQVDRVVVMRDGKISTETIRKVSQLEKALLGGDDSEDSEKFPVVDEVTYQEFVVLDRAGRLQIPEEVREQFGIDRRVQMEVTEEAIIIRPTNSEGKSAFKNLSLEEQVALLFRGEVTPPKKSSLRKKWRLFKRNDEI